MSPPKKKDQQNNKKLKIVLMPNSAKFGHAKCRRTTFLNDRQIKASTIEKRIVAGAAIHRHGFIFKYMDGNDTSTSDENDSM